MPRAETISSAANSLVKDVRRAIARGSLTSQGWAVAESRHLLEEALHSRSQVKTVLAAESALAAAEDLLGASAGVKLVALPDALFRGMSATENTQGIMALVGLPAWKMEDLLRDCPLVVVLDGIQDPGNAGAILRAAEAFGATGALFLKGTASPFHPKTLRAAAGSLFRVPFLYGLDPALASAELKQRGVALYAAQPLRARTLTEADLSQPAALIIGNEGRGVSQELGSAATPVSIPTVAVESLNAAVAAGILLYEARRQRTPS